MSLLATKLLSLTLFETPISAQKVYALPLGTALLLFTVLLLLLVIALIWNSRAYQIPETILAHAGGHDQHPAPKPNDDLTVIEGIGPKTAAAFQAAGILTYQDLVDVDVDKLKTSIRKLSAGDIDYLMPGHMEFLNGPDEVKRNFEVVIDHILPMV